MVPQLPSSQLLLMSIIPRAHSPATLAVSSQTLVAPRLHFVCKVTLFKECNIQEGSYILAVGLRIQGSVLRGEGHNEFPLLTRPQMGFMYEHHAWKEYKSVTNMTKGDMCGEENASIPATESTVKSRSSGFFVLPF